MYISAINKDYGILLWVLPEIDPAIQEQAVHLGGDPTVGGWEGGGRGKGRHPIEFIIQQVTMGAAREQTSKSPQPRGVCHWLRTASSLSW